MTAPNPGGTYPSLVKIPPGTDMPTQHGEIMTNGEQTVRRPWNRGQPWDVPVGPLGPPTPTPRATPGPTSFDPKKVQLQMSWPHPVANNS